MAVLFSVEIVRGLTFQVEIEEPAHWNFVTWLWLAWAENSDEQPKDMK